MNAIQSPSSLRWPAILLYAGGATVAFHLAYHDQRLSFFIAIYLFCLIQLASLGTPRKAFYIGLTLGLVTCGPQLAFFWTIFNAAAIVLWLVLAFWVALFLLMAQQTRAKFGPKVFVVLVPFLWTGLEYFRSELYYLRFSWVNVGYAFSGQSRVFSTGLGIYGIAFAIVSALSLITLLGRRTSYLATLAFIAGVGLLANLPIPQDHPAPTGESLQVAGVQLEFPSEPEVLLALNKLVKKRPETDLIVLSEYTFEGPVPDKVKAWCRKNSKYLIAGGRDPLTNDHYYNTAFVVSPAGEVVFKQAKKVPIQFFKDGLPAQQQVLWASPWGKIGICICYDLSYRRVVDPLIQQGAEALIVPMMDVSDWGGYQHQLHSRIPPVRAAEYGIPIFRVASSGISQLVNAQGRVQTSAPFPGDGAQLAGRLDLRGRGRLPLDHWLAPAASVLTGLWAIWLALPKSAQWRLSRKRE